MGSVICTCLCNRQGHSGDALDALEHHAADAERGAQVSPMGAGQSSATETLGPASSPSPPRRFPLAQTAPASTQAFADKAALERERRQLVDRFRQLTQEEASRDEYIHSIAWSPDSRHLVTGDDDCTVKVWKLSVIDQASPVLVHAFRGHTKYISAVSWAPDGRMLASASKDSTVRMWSVESDDSYGWASRGTVGRHADGVFALCWSPDSSRIASGGRDRKVKCWSIGSPSNTEIAVGEHGQPVRAVAWSPDGGKLASGCQDGQIVVWTAASLESSQWTIATSVSGHKLALTSLAWSSNPSLLATCSADHTLKLWQVGDAVELAKESTAHSHGVRSVSWSSDSSALLTGSWDRCLKTWDLSLGCCFSTELPCKIEAVSWSPDGAWVAAAGEGAQPVVLSMAGSVRRDGSV